MKTILKKYLAYIRYLTYHEIKNELDPFKRLDMHLHIATSESYLKEVFKLYVMDFEEDKIKGGLP